MWKLPKTNSGLVKKLKEAHNLINKAKFQLAQDKRYELAAELRSFERPLKTGGINKHHGIWTDRSIAMLSKKTKEILNDIQGYSYKKRKR